jgi:hypothetical protein
MLLVRSSTGVWYMQDPGHSGLTKMSVVAARQAAEARRVALAKAHATSERAFRHVPGAPASVEGGRTAHGAATSGPDAKAPRVAGGVSRARHLGPLEPPSDARPPAGRLYLLDRYTYSLVTRPRTLGRASRGQIARQRRVERARTAHRGRRTPSRQTTSSHARFDIAAAMNLLEDPQFLADQCQLERQLNLFTMSRRRQLERRRRACEARRVRATLCVRREALAAISAKTPQRRARPTRPARRSATPRRSRARSANGPEDGPGDARPLIRARSGVSP